MTGEWHRDFSRDAMILTVTGKCCFHHTSHDYIQLFTIHCGWLDFTARKSTANYVHFSLGGQKRKMGKEREKIASFDAKAHVHLCTSI